jgi:hypothetical protein
MKIESIQAFNFKSFDSNGINFLAKQGLTLFQAYKAVQTSIGKGKAFDRDLGYIEEYENNKIRLTPLGNSNCGIEVILDESI